MKSIYTKSRTLLFLITIFICINNLQTTKAQELYFPPVTGNDWETTSPEELGWCSEYIPELYDSLKKNNTKAFIVLKDGKIVLEKYFGTFNQDSVWYWASAGKSLTSFLVGVLKSDGAINLEDKTSKYLGEGWTSLTKEQEDKITVLNQLTMTTGLDDKVSDNTCIDKECLIYKSDAGTRWAYHNAPYTLLDKVIENAYGKSLNSLVLKLRETTGITGLFAKLDNNNVFFSKPRSLARFGLLMLNKGDWNGDVILADKDYYNNSINTSQEINKSYGYLWWLNGKESYMAPQTQFVYKGSLAPNAPKDMFSALGKNGQILNVVPSQNLVVVRMGDSPDGAEVPWLLSNEIWRLLNQVICNQTSIENSNSENDNHHQNTINVFQTIESINITNSNNSNSENQVKIYNLLGLEVFNQYFKENITINKSNFKDKILIINTITNGKSQVNKLILE